MIVRLIRSHDLLKSPTILTETLVKPFSQRRPTQIMILNPVLCKYASLITPQLYLSDYLTTQNEAKLKELGITHVVSLLSTVPRLPECIPADQRLYIDIADVHSSDILKYLEKTTAFITAAISENTKNKVLVCHPPGILIATSLTFILGAL